MYQISVVNRSVAIGDREMHRVIRAINRQVAEDFEPYWAFGGRLRLENSAGANTDFSTLSELRGDAILYILDSASDLSVLGYHDRNLSGIPYGSVFLDLCKQLGDEWSVTLSHETLELIADPLCNLLVQGPHPALAGQTVYHYYEMCDAVQTQSYLLDGVMVSDFVLPEYFSPEASPRRNDFCSSPLAPFGTIPGGYIGFFDPVLGKDDRFFGNDPLAKQRMSLKSSARSGRLFRRGQHSSAGSRDPRTSVRQDAVHRLAVGGHAGDPIRHVVVLMLENRSFDHMVGALKVKIPELDGFDPAHPSTNRDPDTGAQIAQSTQATQFVASDFEVPHEFDDVAKQLQGPMGGFVAAYRTAASATHATAHIDQVMASFAPGTLPALHTLAENFTVCDAWFSSLPGPTWPNRLFVHSGTSLGDVDMPSLSTPSSITELIGRYHQPTIYDVLKDNGHSWQIFHDGFPQSVILDRLKLAFLEGKYGSMDDFKKAAAGKESEFPEYAFIEPRYFSVGNNGENDQHPPASISPGEQLIADVYNAIRANEPLWNSTLLIVTYDEHGGFFDHVVPAQTVAPDGHVTARFAFNRLGVRVPTVLISPWVGRGVDHAIYDHTSILRYLCDKWQLPHLCRRTDSSPGNNAVSSFAHVINQTSARSDTPLSLSAGGHLAAVAAPITVAPHFDKSQEALLAYGEAIFGLTGPAVRGAAVSGAPEQQGGPLSATLLERATMLEARVAQIKLEREKK